MWSIRVAGSPNRPRPVGSAAGGPQRGQRRDPIQMASQMMAKTAEHDPGSRTCVADYGDPAEGWPVASHRAEDGDGDRAQQQRQHEVAGHREPGPPAGVSAGRLPGHRHDPGGHRNDRYHMPEQHHAHDPGEDHPPWAARICLAEVSRCVSHHGIITGQAADLSACPWSRATISARTRQRRRSRSRPASGPAGHRGKSARPRR